MPARTTFGKRSAPQAFAPRVAASRTPPARAATPPVTPRNDAFDAFYAGGIPVVTCCLIAILVLIFATEIHFTPDATQSLSPSRQALITLGGVEGKLVFGGGEWWRLFTAPLLHASLSHIMGNSIALFLAGMFLEPLIGAGWFGALFFAAALGGAAGSLAQNDPAMVSVGASGAISGLLAGGLCLSAREKDPARRRRMQIMTARILIPAVAPIFFQEANTGGTDYGAHAGGAITGILFCIMLSAVWHGDTKRPAFQHGAFAATGVGVIMAVVAFALTGMNRGTYTAMADTLIPQDQIPHTGTEGASHSAELVARYPTDPRSRLYRAMYFYGQHDRSDAADQLRTGIADLSAHPDDFKPTLEQALKMTLAQIQYEEGDHDTARDTARESCAAADPSTLLETMKREKICD